MISARPPIRASSGRTSTHSPATNASADRRTGRPRSLLRSLPRDRRATPATSRPSSTTAGRDRPAPNRFRVPTWRSRGRAAPQCRPAPPRAAAGPGGPAGSGAYSRPAPSIRRTTPATLSTRASTSATYSSRTGPPMTAAEIVQIGPQRRRVRLDPLALVEHRTVAGQQVSYRAQHDEPVVGDPATLPRSPAEQGGGHHHASQRLTWW